jgi:hypothetical protein
MRVDDELLEQLKAQARREQVSVTRLLNRALRAGLKAVGVPRRRRPAYRERVYAMGVPRLALDKALAVAAALEDEVSVRELTVRK